MEGPMQTIEVTETTEVNEGQYKVNRYKVNRNFGLTAIEAKNSRLANDLDMVYW